MGFKQASLQKPYTTWGSGANACPDPPCPGRGRGPRSRSEGVTKGHRGTAGARHVGAADGEGKGSLPWGRRPFSLLLLPCRFTGGASGAAAVRARRGGLVLKGRLGQPPCRPRETSVTAAGCATPHKPTGKADGEAPRSGSGSRTGRSPGPRAGDTRRRRGQRGPPPPRPVSH